MTTPTFEGNPNIALKVPRFRFQDTVRFYRDVLGMPLLGRSDASEAFPEGSPGFDFGGRRLWVDEMPTYTHAAVWLQVHTPDLEGAVEHVRRAGMPVRDELEPFGDFPGHWISDPAGNVLALTLAGAEVEVRTET